MMEQAVGKGLLTTSEDDLTDVLLGLEETVPGRTDPYTDIDASYELVTRQRQVILSCFEELIALRAVTAINDHLDRGGALTDRLPYEGNLRRDPIFSRQYEHSGKVETSVHTYFSWLEPALREVLDSPSAAPLLSVGEDMHRVFNWARYKWIYESTHTRHFISRRMCRPIVSYNLTEDLEDVVATNSVLSLSTLVMRGVAHDFYRGPMDKAAFIASQVDETTWLASGRRSISMPYFAQSEEMLVDYDAWDSGKINTREFWDKISQNPPSPFGYAHKSLAHGPFDKIGRCPGGVPFVRPETIIAAQELLKHAGVTEIPPSVSMAHVFIALGQLVCVENIYPFWPERSRD